MPHVRWMDNEVYGHAAILRAYCETSEPRHILRHVQHGWNPGSGWTLGDRELLRRTAPRAVWGRRQLAWYSDRGIRKPPAIGAPFLYLLQMLRITPNGSQGGGTVAFPYHGTDEHSVAYAHESLAEAFVAAERKVTVCLHENEFRNTSVTRAYSERGLAITTLGEKHNPFFLVRLVALLNDHERAVSNRTSTALFYAGYLGLELAVYGPEAVINVEDTAPKDILRGASLSSHDAHALAHEELGAGHLREPGDLKNILGLSRGYSGRASVRLSTSIAARAIARPGRWLRP
jgi:hypothetical protein